ncbi:MAG: DUF2281 domain-containing protein [Treponema sp.]|nr:DUF2281 domain-containing protein [Treponema sp.]
MSYIEQILEEIKTLPANRVAEVLDFVEFLKRKEEKYITMSKEDAISMVSDIINEYRPALEELAK